MWKNYNNVQRFIHRLIKAFYQLELRCSDWPRERWIVVGAEEKGASQCCLSCSTHVSDLVGVATASSEQIPRFTREGRENCCASTNWFNPRGDSEIVTASLCTAIKSLTKIAKQLKLKSYTRLTMAVQKGWATPPLTMNQAWPLDSWSPKPTPSVWIESTYVASPAETRPVIGIKMFWICPGSMPVSLPATSLLLVTLRIVRAAIDWICAPSENPTRWSEFWLTPASISRM